MEDEKGVMEKQNFMATVLTQERHAALRQPCKEERIEN